MEKTNFSSTDQKDTADVVLKEHKEIAIFYVFFFLIIMWINKGIF
jgi:hypothetical protein